MRHPSIVLRLALLLVTATALDACDHDGLVGPTHHPIAAEGQLVWEEAPSLEVLQAGPHHARVGWEGPGEVRYRIDVDGMTVATTRSTSATVVGLSPGKPATIEVLPLSDRGGPLGAAASLEIMTSGAEVTADNQGGGWRPAISTECADSAEPCIDSDGDAE